MPLPLHPNPTNKYADFSILAPRRANVDNLDSRAGFALAQHTLFELPISMTR